jgi:hypothetical protein
MNFKVFKQHRNETRRTRLESEKNMVLGFGMGISQREVYFYYLPPHEEATPWVEARSSAFGCSFFRFQHFVTMAFFS